MTFQQLYYLLEVEKTGSFSTAAKRLFVTQSTISNTVASLEKEIGNPIFIRGKKVLTLSPTGEEVLAHAKRICESHKYLTTGKRTHNPALRIGSVGFPPARNAFVQLIEENADRDDISFVFHDGRNRDFEEELLAYRMDVAVAMFIENTVEKTLENFRKKGLYYEKLITLPGAICIGPGHRLYEAPELSVEDFKNDWFIAVPSRAVRRRGSGTMHLPGAGERTIGSSHGDVRKSLLQRGVGYTMTYMHSKKEREQGSLRYIPIPGLYYSFFVFYDHMHPITPEISRFLELLREHSSEYII